MSRNSWWSYSYIEQNFSEPNDNKSSTLKKNLILTEKQQKNVDSSSFKEHGCSESIIREISTDVSDNVSTTTTLVGTPSTTMDNKNVQASDAIPIPKNQNSRYDEQKNKSTSSFISWWSSSSASTPSYNQKDILVNNNNNNHNNSIEEKQKLNSNSNFDKTKPMKHEKQFLRHENGSSISILTPINENGLYRKQFHEAELSRSDSRLNMESVDKNSIILRKGSDSKLSTSYSSNSSTSSRGWWMFGGGNNTVSRDDVSSSNNVANNTTKPEAVSKQIKEVDTINKQTDQGSKQVLSDNKDSNNSNKDSNTTSITSDVENSSSNGRARRVKKKSSSEIRRWSLFNTWSPSTTNLLESTGEGENSKTASEDLASKSINQSPPSPPSPPPSSSSSSSSSSHSSAKSKSESSNSNIDIDKNGNTSKKDSQSSQDSNNNKKKPSKSDKRSTNPIVKSIPEHRSSWVHFFTNVSRTQSKGARIDKRTDRKLITNGSASHPVERKDSLKVSTTVEVEKVEKVEKKASMESTVSASPTLKPVPSNVVLPTFEEFAKTRPHRRPNSMIQQALHAVNSYFFPPDKSSESTLPKWLDEITRSTVDVKRIAIIGVHGWFPAKLVRAVVGEPTGTSPKFCDMMAKAILGYLSQHGIILPSDAITCIPLEGEGTTSTREELLHKNLIHNKTWCEALSLADVVFVATHSQGTPVSTVLLSRLINEGCVNPKRQRICMLAMAGISHGPFPYLKENYIVKYYVGAGRSHDADAARELFEYMDSESLVSKRYREALNNIIQNGIKLVYVASMDDQVVPLYSGIFTGVDHPSIMRAIYIDGPLYRANDFLTNLIVFAIRLRNAGILDNGVIVQLSEVVAGSMYGEGHSALYNEIDVYTLAVRYLFETPSLDSCCVNLERFLAQQKNNPFYLPWAMRGILEDKKVLESQKLKYEVLKLRKQYEEWEPATKSMKEVKYRLEPLREAIFGRTKL